MSSDGARGLRAWGARLLGLGPVAPPPHAFAVDSGRLRYAGFRREGTVLALVETAAVELPDDLFAPGPLGAPARDPARLAEAVAALVERLDATVREASLVLPDAWLRLAFTDAAELPSGPQRDDVLRWKLKRLVPFRVEELRLAGVEVAPLPDQPSDEPRRVLLGFAVDALLGQLEEAFAAAGVRIGRIVSESLAVIAAVEAGGPPAAPTEAEPPLEALVLVGGEGYTLSFVRSGMPVLHRHKGLAGALPAESQGSFAVRDLRLTRSFLDEQFPEVRLGRTLVTGSPETMPRWVEWMGEALGVRAQPLGREHLPQMAPVTPPPVWRELAPLVGAVSQEVR